MCDWIGREESVISVSQRKEKEFVFVSNRTPEKISGRQHQEADFVEVPSIEETKDEAQPPTLAYMQSREWNIKELGKDRTLEELRELWYEKVGIRREARQVISELADRLKEFELGETTEERKWES